jgi:hypothetical protein
VNGFLCWLAPVLGSPAESPGRSGSRAHAKIKQIEQNIR